jgi:hypothetical protein
MPRSPRGRAALVAAAALALSGCFHYDDPARRALEKAMRTVRTVGLVAPTVKVFELDAGGMRVPREAWSEQVRKNVTDAIGVALTEKGLVVKPIEPTARTRDELDDLRLLYEAVGQAELDARRFYFVNKWKDGFEYSVGPVQALFAKQGIDALLLSYGSDEISTGGRVAKATLAAIIGVHVASGVSFVNLALVDRTGRVVFFRVHASEGGADLRDAGTVQNIVDSLVRELPGAGGRS